MKIVSLYSKNHTHDYVLSQLQKKYGDDLYKIEETQDVQDAISRVLKRKNTTIISKINVLLFFIYYFLLRGSFRTGGSGAVERKMDLSYYGSSEGILGLGSWVGQNNLTRKTERLDCWDLLT